MITCRSGNATGNRQKYIGRYISAGQALFGVLVAGTVSCTLFVCRCIHIIRVSSVMNQCVS